MIFEVIFRNFELYDNKKYEEVIKLSEKINLKYLKIEFKKCSSFMNQFNFLSVIKDDKLISTYEKRF